MTHGVVDAAYRARMNESHTREFRLRSWKWIVQSTDPNATGTKVPLGLILPGGREIYDIPIEDGELTLDSTDEYVSRLRVVVPGEQWIPTSAMSPLAPFGQFLTLEVRLDGPDGNWLPFIPLGQFPILSNSVDRPSGTITVEATSWAQRVDEYGFERIFTAAKNTSVEADVREIVRQALPNNAYAVRSSPVAKQEYYDQKATSRFGQGRWDFIRTICSDNGLEAVWDRYGDLLIRNSIYDADGYTTGIPDYDVGAYSNPVGVLSEDRGGNITALTPTTTRENAANGVHVRVVPAQSTSGTQAGKEQVRSALILKGDALYGDTFGRLTIHREITPKKVTQKVLDNAKREAEALLARRGGVLRQLEIEALPQWYLDPDDRINVTWRKRMPDFTEQITTEGHYVEAITFPLTPEGSMQIRTRQVVVRQLEQDWVMEPEPDPDYVPPNLGDIPTPPGLLPEPAPVPTLAPNYQLLEQYRADIAANPSTYPTNYTYGKVTSIQDGDTFTVSIFSDSACTKPGTIKHPDGSYGSMRLRLIGVQAPEPGWGAGGPGADAHIRTLVAVGKRVMIRWDAMLAADASGTRRLWVEAYIWRDLEKDWRNVTLHMIDGGWGVAFPLRDANRNSKNRIARMKQAMWHGYGLFATAGAQHGNISINVMGNPAGDDTTKNEYATLRNLTGAPISIAGWHFGDPSPNTTMTFPAGAVIPANGTVRVNVGKGTNNTATGVYYQQESAPIWNNTGDCAYLWDTNWRISAVGHYRDGSTEQVLIKPTTPTLLSGRIGEDPELTFPGIGVG